MNATAYNNLSHFHWIALPFSQCPGASFVETFLHDMATDYVILQMPRCEQNVKFLTVGEASLQDHDATIMRRW